MSDILFCIVLQQLSGEMILLKVQIARTLLFLIKTVSIHFVTISVAMFSGIVINDKPNPFLRSLLLEDKNLKNLLIPCCLVADVLL